jgi:hypothetical protein
MPDISAFTLGLFDNTALSSWNQHTLKTAVNSYEADIPSHFAAVEVVTPATWSTVRVPTASQRSSPRLHRGARPCVGTDTCSGSLIAV